MIPSVCRLTHCYYAGIGSRETPESILSLMEKIAMKMVLVNRNILRSGGADGADAAFQRGVEEAKGPAEIYIPWNGFNNLSHGYRNAILVKDGKIIQSGEQLAKQFHPNFAKLSIGGKKLMIRNAFQIYGSNFNHPSRFVICWTKDAADGLAIKTSYATGGTGQAIRLAAYAGVPVENLANPDTLAGWEEWIKETS